MAGMKVVVVKCDEAGNVDLVDLKEKINVNRETLAALMITYPSTHGVFEEAIRDICRTGLDDQSGGQLQRQRRLRKALLFRRTPGNTTAIKKDRGENSVSQLDQHQSSRQPSQHDS